MLALDTSVLIELEDENEKVMEILSELRKSHPEKIVIPFPVFSEFYYGLLRISGNIDKNLEFLQSFPILNSTENSARLFSQIKLGLEKRGRAMELFDMLIAAISIDSDVTLATADKAFKRIPDLKLFLIKL